MLILPAVHRISRIALLVIAPTILLLSLIGSPPGPDITHGDKIAHLIAYGTLGFFAYLALAKPGAVALALSVGLCSLYGGAIEILQHHVYRTPELGDWIADGVGALGGSLLAAALARHLARRRATRT